MNWFKDRCVERTSWDGAWLLALGVLVLVATPIAKLLAWVAVIWGVWTICKSE
jgi:hypothetical protein